LLSERIALTTSQPMRCAATPRLTAETRNMPVKVEEAAHIKKVDWQEMNASGRSWTEDAPHENGNYLCECFECEKFFIGHKRRVVCKLCSVPDAERRSESMNTNILNTSLPMVKLPDASTPEGLAAIKQRCADGIALTGSYDRLFDLYIEAHRDRCALLELAEHGRCEVTP
jgi:hypothetical protein